MFKFLFPILCFAIAAPGLAQDTAHDNQTETEQAATAEPAALAPRLNLELDLPPAKRWGIVIHGGAGSFKRGSFTPEKEAAYRDGLKSALDIGAAVLASGGSALDAVEASVAVLEDDPNFNAGRGAVLTYDGTIALDAAIMDGRDRSAGAVAGTSIAKHPVKAARKVRNVGPHVLLSGAGADQFVRDHDLETANQDWFETPERRRQLDDMLKRKVGWVDGDLKYGTVGAVALDSEGHVAAATSTGGLTGKRWGRIGDSPLIGAGTYADDRSCAVSATGTGETFIRVGVAHEICARVRMKGDKIVPAAQSVLAEVTALGGSGGVILIAPDGQMGWSYTTPGMFRAGKDSAGKERIAIYGDE